MGKKKDIKLARAKTKGVATKKRKADASGNAAATSSGKKTNEAKKKRTKNKSSSGGAQNAEAGQSKLISEYEIQQAHDPEIGDEDVDFVESLGQSTEGSSFLRSLHATDFRPSGADRKVSQVTVC